jgi:hypothetical protein
MKNSNIVFCLIVWCFFTTILALSIVGWIVLLPQLNMTDYYKPQSELRSTWMRIGIDLKEG